MWRWRTASGRSATATPPWTSRTSRVTGPGPRPRTIQASRTTRVPEGRRRRHRVAWADAQRGMTMADAAVLDGGIRVIDTDTHVTEPPDLWTSRVASKWL